MADITVRQFRQILLWPLQLTPTQEGVQIQKHSELFAQVQNNPWREIADPFAEDQTRFLERHYREFVTFLPHVQRFLYGQGMGKAVKRSYGESPIRAFRRSDLAKVRVTGTQGEEETLFDIERADLYFFYDLDIAILALEIGAENVSLARVQDMLFKFGRAYPAYWEDSGAAAHCLKQVEWLSHAGEVLAVADYDRREKYLAFVRQHRAPCIASHWEYLLEPMALHHSERKGAIRYRQIEHYRMPSLAYLALDGPTQLSRGDFARLALAAEAGDSNTLPYSEQYLADFEQRYCYDRHWDELGSSRRNTRFTCSSHGFVMVGDYNERFFIDAETGLLCQFRHQYFLLGLIVYFHRAALLMLSDRLIVAISKLDIQQPDSIRQFKRAIRHTQEIFLRFTHRYWFHEVSEQVPVRDLFRRWNGQLGTHQLFAETREEIDDMSRYLERDGLRRQANTVVRLTVVTTFGLIGTVATGFLGMNLIAAADQPLLAKIAYFLAVFIPVMALAFYTIVKSKRLSDFLDLLSDERLSGKAKLAAFVRVWKRSSRSA